MNIKVKKLNSDAVMPSYAREGDAAVDLTASTHFSLGIDYVEYGTGLAFEIPAGHVGLIFPRSSISKTNLSLSNAVGVLDSGFRGEVTFRFRRLNDSYPTYRKGDRIGQLVIIPYPKLEFVEAEELGETERGEGSYGSSGR